MAANFIKRILMKISFIKYKDTVHDILWLTLFANWLTNYHYSK